MHDSKGNPLSVGDKVTVEFTVRDLSASEKDCNVTLVSVDTPAYRAIHTNPSNVIVTTNTKLVTKAVLVALCLILSCLTCAPAYAQCSGGSCLIRVFPARRVAARPHVFPRRR